MTLEEIFDMKGLSDDKITEAEIKSIRNADYLTEETFVDLKRQSQESGSCNGFIRGQLGESKFNMFLLNEIKKGRNIKLLKRPVDQTGSKKDHKFFCGDRIIDNILYKGKEISCQTKVPKISGLKHINGKWYITVGCGSSDKHESETSDNNIIDSCLTLYGCFDFLVIPLYHPTRDWNMFAYILNSDLKKTTADIPCAEEYIHSSQTIIYDPIKKPVEPPATLSFDEILDRVFLKPSKQIRETKKGVSVIIDPFSPDN